MRKLFTRTSQHLLAGTLALALAAPAAAATLWRWTTEDGTVAFTDDAKRIPARYRGEAEKRIVGGLADYGRFTPEDAAAGSANAERVAARVERLRALNAALDGAGAGHGAPAVHGVESGVMHETVLRLGRRGMVRVPTPAANEEPVILEQRRVRPEGSMVTRHVTIVRQGDRVLSVIRPQSTHQPLSWPDEGELVE